MSTDDKDTPQSPLDEVDPKARAALMIIMAAMKKSTDDAKQYLAMIIRQALTSTERAAASEEVMQIAEAMLDAAMKLHVGRGKIAMAALCLSDIITEDLFNDCFPEFAKKKE